MGKISPIGRLVRRALIFIQQHSSKEMSILENSIVKQSCVILDVRQSARKWDWTPQRSIRFRSRAVRVCYGIGLNCLGSELLQSSVILWSARVVFEMHE